ncbi:hypothetical protein BU16DRAFT_568315 [Lophium mytilinum]|uniref:Uncharacterized protein n=1 Tax=Lophium mytilinum TaxID=390894 RepID=A0A6A6Q909_9PEZI|nr:hypothetical protein BU16DRAFT_568315 [Lophium mytilinum]
MTAPISTCLSTTPPADPEEHVFRPLVPEEDTFALKLLKAYYEPGVLPLRDDPFKRLPAPDSFHALTHHLSLYILALRHDEAQLADAVYIQIRHYYASTGHTASPFRLEYVYNHTEGPNALRAFLAETAACRLVLCRDKRADAARGVVGPEEALSKSMRALVAKGGDLAVDLMAAVVRLSVYA